MILWLNSKNYVMLRFYRHLKILSWNWRFQKANKSKRSWISKIPTKKIGNQAKKVMGTSVKTIVFLLILLVIATMFFLCCCYCCGCGLSLMYKVSSTNLVPEPGFLGRLVQKMFSKEPIFSTYLMMNESKSFASQMFDLSVIQEWTMNPELKLLK